MEQQPGWPWGHWSTLVSTTFHSSSLLATSFLCSKGWYVWSFRSEVQKLGCKTYEVLEEVFQRLQFKVMHLE